MISAAAMASSEVDIVSSSPFGCVLRDHNHNHNRKEGYRQTNVRAVQAVFDKNFKELVRDHINGCISLSSTPNLQNQISHVSSSSWLTNEQPNANPHNFQLFNKNQPLHHHHNDVNSNINHIQDEEPSSFTSKNLPVLDRWVMRLAQDLTASTIQKLVNQAAEPLLVPSNSNPASLTTSMATCSKTKNAKNLENAKATHNLGASSLVQIWEARLNCSNSINSNQTQNQSQSIGPTTSRASSCLSSNENNASPVEENSTTGDPLDEKFDNRTNHENSLLDWDSQSDRTAPGEPPSSSSPCSRSFDAGESERVRIADIIKRLKNGREDGDDHEHSSHVVTDSQSREHKHISTSDQAEQRCFSQVVNSPRLRGRQAFNDLLMQIERDKKRELDSLVERQAVSKFSQRGRLQSMLRLKCLQRSATIQDKCRPQSPGAHVNRLPQPQESTIMHLIREKFSTSADQNDSATPRCHHGEVLTSSVQLDKSSTSKAQYEGTHCQKVSFAGNQSTSPVNRLTVNKKEDLHEQANSSVDAIQQQTSLEATCLESLKFADSRTALESQSENEMAKKKGSISNIQQCHIFPDSQKTAETTTSLHDRAENEIAKDLEVISNSKPQHLCLHSQEIVENSTSSYSDRDENEVFEELEDHYQQYFDETNDDWFRNISRPRSYWEGLRKAWYEEVLNTTSKDEEIRQLLERGRVSTFLASDFREKMDQLMISRVQMRADQAENQDQEVNDEERMVEVMSYLQSHLHPAGAQDEEEEQSDEVQEEEEEEDDEEEVERSLINRQGHEASNYFNQSSSSIQMPSPSDMMRSWSFQDDNETGNDSDGVPSTFSPPPGPSQAHYYEDNIKSTSFIGRPSSLEMELICDLRGHMEQLQHEMGELRKSILSCMDMQMKFQHYSFSRQDNGVREGRNSAADMAPWKRSCSICYEMQVDSLLYRCGHMCTCLKCAHELQWSSGKCPICGAPILDVVPAKFT